MNGTVRLSVLWTDEICLRPDDAERVAHALLRAAEHGRRIAEERDSGPVSSTSAEQWGLSALPLQGEDGGGD
ncbi:hypothetical protein [Streptomyces sviceus]|uniref:hypothetical protein n=1 Tax=Streptomyces sviceus TaxID=285530 RepID=UPI0036EFBC33